MTELTGMIACDSCGNQYGVELRKMRLNISSTCPACGSPNGISERQAIEAQRLLERSEMEGTFAKVA